MFKNYLQILCTTGMLKTFILNMNTIQIKKGNQLKTELVTFFVYNPTPWISPWS